MSPWHGSAQDTVLRSRYTSSTGPEQHVKGYAHSIQTMLLHLSAHAVFKATLFMAIGLLLHACGQQDSRAMPSAVLCVLSAVSYTVITKYLL